MDRKNNIVQIQDLNNKGFCIIRSFFSRKEINMSILDFNSKPDSENLNYNVPLAGSEFIKNMREKFDDLIDSINSETDITVNFSNWWGYFSTTKFKPFGWHQDHESYFLYQDHYNYLNCYIPIIKPFKDKSNLSIIPFDLIKDKSPGFYRKMIGGGATYATIQNGKATVMYDNNDDSVLDFLDYNINDFSVTPELEVGDLLILRGDVIHKTQDNFTNRTALSVRLCNSETILSREKFLSGGKFKISMMMNNYREYDKALGVYKMNKSGKVKLGDFQKYLSDERPSKNKDCYSFFKDIMRQKWRRNLWGVTIE